MKSSITRDLALATADMVRISSASKSSAARFLGVSPRALGAAWSRHFGFTGKYAPKRGELSHLARMGRVPDAPIDVRALHVAHVAVESAIRNERAGANNETLINAWCEAMTTIELVIGAINHG